MYLALCLLASSSRIQFPDELANAQLVLHSDDDQMRSKILDPIEKDDERDELLHHVETVETRSENPETGSENPEKGSENPDVQHIHVHVYLSKDNYHHSRFNYLNSLHCKFHLWCLALLAEWQRNFPNADLSRHPSVCPSITLSYDMYHFVISLSDRTMTIELG